MRNSSGCKTPRLMCSVAMLVAWHASLAVADELDPLSAYVSESFARDSNLFRLPAGVSPTRLGVSADSRADSVRTDTVGIKLNKLYAMQRFSANASIANNRFANFHFLDYVAKNFDGRWDWALTPQLSGALGAGRKQTLNSFADYQSYVRNVRTVDNLRASAEYGVRGPWRALGAIEEIKVADSVPQAQTWNTRTHAIEGGVKYVSSAGSAFGYMLLRNHITWPGRPLDPVGQYDNQARQTDHEFVVESQPGGKTRAKGIVTRVTRKHDAMVARDYSGTAGRLEIGWAPTATLRLDLLARREYASWWDGAASYTVTDGLLFSPVWQISPKLALRGRVEQANRDFLGQIQPLVGASRHDVTRTGLLAIDWAPWRSVALSASWQLDRRRSTLDGLDYRDTIAGVAARIGF
jgi:exopolysaccharide biosynthesis operon protein EpsL